MIAFYLARTRFGLNVRAVGESPDAADTMGISVTRYRYVHVLAGGALAGVGGRLLQPLDHAAAGRPATRSSAARAGSRSRSSSSRSGARSCACSERGCSAGCPAGCRSAIQARDAVIRRSSDPEFLNALPYIATIVVLVIIATGWAKRRLGAPAALGVPYVREER